LANNKKKRNKGGAQKKGGGKGFPVTGVVLTVLLILIGIGAGVGIWLFSQGESNAIELVEADLPGYVNRADAPPGAEKAYRVALTIPDDLAQIPCYCSCGDSAGHESNLDCFIKSKSGDNVVFDDHAAY
jgi:hypothetical protein